MKRQQNLPKQKTAEKIPSIWKSIVWVIIFSFAIVALFGLIIFLLVRGGQQMGLSTTGYLAILVVTSGVFAWLVKRLSDSVSDMSDRWFPPESNGQD